MTLGYRKMTPSRFQDALVKTLEISVLILFLVAASNFFGAVFSRLGTPTMLTNALLSFDLSQIEVLIVVMVLIFILGWPLEWVPIVLIIVPILIPLLDKMEIQPDLVRHPGGGEPPDRVALATGGPVGITSSRAWCPSGT